MKLGNGSSLSLLLKKSPIEPDRVKNYAHLVLELGLEFKSLLSVCKMPGRARGLALLKTAMIQFKANNNLSKYSYEVLRLLVHQYVTLSEKAAMEEFYGLFVNTKGKSDSHIPCDLQMEYIVKDVKTNIKHMFSNKTEKNISTRIAALPTMKDISDNFDKTTGVIVRSKKHSDTDAIPDERAMIRDIHGLKPFKCNPGRVHASFPNVKKQMGALLNVEQFNEWLKFQKYKFATELGN